MSKESLFHLTIMRQMYQRNHSYWYQKHETWLHHTLIQQNWLIHLHLQCMLAYVSFVQPSRLSLKSHEVMNLMFFKLNKKNNKNNNSKHITTEMSTASDQQTAQPHPS